MKGCEVLIMLKIVLLACAWVFWMYGWDGWLYGVVVLSSCAFPVLLCGTFGVSFFFCGFSGLIHVGLLPFLWVSVSIKKR
jgi:hypothetical protein